MDETSFSLPGVLPPKHVVHEFHSLATNLYSLKDPEQIRASNDRLQSLQRSEYAYNLAASLFRPDQDASTAFLAILTVTIKTNHEHNNLEPSDISKLVLLVLRWLRQAVELELPKYVTQKICSTLAGLYMESNCEWTYCVAEVITHLTGESMGEIIESDNIPSAFVSKEAQMSTALMFFNTVAEDLRKLPHNTSTDDAYRRLAMNVNPLVQVLSKTYQQVRQSDNQRNVQLICSAMVPQCHLQWIKFSKSNAVSDEDKALLTSLLPIPISLLTKIAPSDVTFESLCSLLESVYKDTGVFVTEDIEDSTVSMLQSSVAREHIEMEGGYAELDDVIFNRMVLAFCRRQCQHVFLPPNTQAPASSQDLQNPAKVDKLAARRSFTMDLVHCITSSLLHHPLEENLAMATIEFWEDFVQDTRDHEMRDQAMNYVLGSIEGFCRASNTRDEDEDDEGLNFYEAEEEEFRGELRTRLRDLLQVCCEEYGIPVFERLLTVAETIWSQSDEYGDIERELQKLESTVFFLVNLSDSLRFASSVDILDPAEDAALERLFRSEWFQTILIEDIEVPEKLRVLGLRLLGGFTIFFGEHPDQLLPALEILVKFMRQSSVAAPAAIALRDLCDRNRWIIAAEGQLKQLLDVCSQYISYPAALREAKAAIVAAVASVAEASQEPENAGETMNQLLFLLQQEYQTKISAAKENAILRSVAAHDILNLLLAAGRAAQSLTDDDDALNDQQRSQRYTVREKYWSSSGGQDSQNQILQLVNSILQNSLHDNSVVAKACEIIRTGYREELPGPFVFRAEVTADFVQSMTINDDNAATLVKLIAEFISAQHNSFSPNLKVTESLMGFVVQIVTRLGDARSDPELASLCLGAMERTLRLDANLLLAQREEALSQILRFALECLANPELQSKRSSANFWNALLSESTKATASAQQQWHELITRVGPFLTQVLVGNFAGSASRADLDRLVDPFRTLIGKYAEARLWLGQALNNSTIPDERINAQQKKRFMDTVLMLRGSAKTKSTVREFWTQCKGLPTSYG